MRDLTAKEYKKFEEIKHIRDDGSEYWKNICQYNKKQRNGEFQNGAYRFSAEKSVSPVLFGLGEYGLFRQTLKSQRMRGLNPEST